MQTINIDANGNHSKILIGEKIENLSNYLPDLKKTVVIADANLIKYYKKHFSSFPIIEIGLGEKNKTMETLDLIFSKFIENEVDRTWFVLGIGGGIVCDVTGFAASIYMRGLRFGFVSTTPLSQVDASVGGKNGVNFEGFKNMIGVFNQPEFVICDATMFNTLPHNEYIAGLAEIVKAGAIRNFDLFEYLEDHIEGILKKDPKVVEKIVYESVMMKASVVQNDEKEKGERRILNFGHTFAHSLEKLTGMLHGEAVSIGMVMASKLSVRLEHITDRELNRIVNLLQRLTLPVDCNIGMEEILSAMKKDKKREGDSIHLVLIDKIGNAFTAKKTLKQLEELIHDLC